MMAIVRNLAGSVASSLPAPALTRLGAQSVAALSSRTWIVQDNTPYVTSTTPLSKRFVEVGKPASGAATETVSDKPPAKPPLEMRCKLKDGRDCLVRRPEDGDRTALAAFMEETGVGAGLPMYTRTLCDTAVDNFLWLASAPGHDALVAEVEGRIVGVSSIDPETHELAPAKNSYFLRSHGLEPSQVCVGYLSVRHDLEGLGIGTALKQAESLAAARAGYQGITHDGYTPMLKGIVRKLGGTIEEGSANGWTLLRTKAKDVKSQ